MIRDKDAERKKLEEEEQEFQQKRRERERKIIQIEKEELDRREDEVWLIYYAFLSSLQLTLIYRLEEEDQNMIR